MAEPKYKYKSKELQEMSEWKGEDRLNEDIKRFGGGGLYGGEKARKNWNADLIQLSPELDEAFERKEFGPQFTYGGKYSSDKHLTSQVKEVVADNPALAVELGFTKKAGRKLPKNKKGAVKLLLDIKSITETPGSAEALGIDLTESGMTPAFWKDESDKKLGRVAFAYQDFEDDIKEYQDIERMESEIEPLQIRRTSEDKIMDSWEAGDSKSNIMGE